MLISPFSLLFLKLYPGGTTETLLYQKHRLADYPSDVLLQLTSQIPSNSAREEVKCLHAFGNIVMCNIALVVNLDIPQKIAGLLCHMNTAYRMGNVFIYIYLHKGCTLYTDLEA